MPPTAGAAAAHARFVMLRHLPLLVVDLEPQPAPVATDDDRPGPSLGGRELAIALAERGMVTLPRFYDVDLPRGVNLGLTIEDDGMRLEDAEETTLLRLPRAGVDQGWIDAALRLRGTMLCIGTAIGVGPDHTPHELCDLLDLAASADRVLGAIVGVAEPRSGLPLVF